ncbi:MAG: SagB/ThcOx family dehydrogenase [Culturomica sp.]|jgi:nitroreductase|nr:SagB/ThcOx family dehydrogenase [Culturomica sp.]
MKATIILAGLILMSCFANAQDIKLNAPDKTGGKTVMEALSLRRTERTYVKKEMPVQMVSDLLWAANGFNRPTKRTAPTAMNKQETELYVMFDNGVYFYDAKENILKLVAKGDFRNTLGQQNISDNASLSIIMVGDLDKSSEKWAAVTSGYISQNIYLFASAHDNIGTVARGGGWKNEELKQILKLGDKQIITLIQAVGYLK